MQIGRLDKLVTVQATSASPDGNVYTDLRRQWMSLEPIGASKLVFLSAQGSTVTHVATAREKPALEVGQRLVWDGQSYKVVAVQRFAGEKQEVEAELLV